VSVGSTLSGGRVRVWSVQTRDVLDALAAGRMWRAHVRHVPVNWRPAYRWMARQLALRVGSPAWAAPVPVWVWCQWRDAGRPRPDLRARAHLPPGTAGVRLELEVETVRLLCSDFELWHYVLNGWYLPASAAEGHGPDAHPDPGRRAASWQRIFDLDWQHPGYTVAREAKSIQGVLWELRPGDLRSATTFVAR
jgi:hypothetical protein